MMGPKSKYTDKVGRYRTKSLFVETIQRDQLDSGMVPVYTFRGHPDYINACDVYLLARDPTGYKAALDIVGSWKHWQHLRALPWFEERRLLWARELEVKLTSDQIHRMRNFAQNKDSTGYQATKWLAEQPWISKAQKRGRPSEAEKKELLKSAVAEDNETQDEAERIFTPPSASDTLPAN